jgi:hypothetical protein
VFAKDKRKTPGEMRGGRDVGPRGKSHPRVLMRQNTDRDLRLQLTNPILLCLGGGGGGRRDMSRDRGDRDRGDRGGDRYSDRNRGRSDSRDRDRDRDHRR